VLTYSAIDSLAHQLAAVLASLNLPATAFGHPEVVERAATAAAQAFQCYAKAQPSKADAYAAALAFMRGQNLDERQRDLVAGALSERIREQSNSCVLGHPKLPMLLDKYSREAEAGDLWRLTWFGLLGSYFSFDPAKSSEAEQSGWESLRAFLKQTWPLIDRQSGKKVVPDWVTVLRRDPGLVGENAAYRYALDYLLGDDEAVQRLSTDLAIPESSWFWQQLVLCAVERSAEQSDDRFKASIPKLLSLISARPVYRDTALEIMLTRYHRCADTSVHVQLCDYLCRKDVWKNPKLRAAGMATAWNRVEDDVWRMALQWVNKANLRDFFEVLAARRQADEGRLDFWSQYMEQISWTRLIFSSQTRTLAYSNEGIRNLIAREEGSYASMSSNADVDAFMMQLGGYLVIEFSKVPNAAYIYKADELPFEPYSREYSGNSEDLKYGYRHDCAARIPHPPGWEGTARYELQKLGIYPDKPEQQFRARPATSYGSSELRGRSSPDRPAGASAGISSGVTSSSRAVGNDGAPVGAKFKMRDLRVLIANNPGAFVNDRRGASGGRLWVNDPTQRAALGVALTALGFKWANKRLAWYYPEDTDGAV
jgi:hypothetical protein